LTASLPGKFFPHRDLCFDFVGAVDLELLQTPTACMYTIEKAGDERHRPRNNALSALRVVPLLTVPSQNQGAQGKHHHRRPRCFW